MMFDRRVWIMFLPSWRNIVSPFRWLWSIEIYLRLLLRVVGQFDRN